MKIVEPVVLHPLAAEWEAVKQTIAKAKQVRRKDDLYLVFRERLGAFRVLDPACGSGNFLYLALRHLKDFDLRVEQEAKALGVTADPKGQRITPKTVLGIEINPYAAELARVTVWIGELQWQLRNGYGITRRPILGKLGGVENRDALLNEDGTETQWPKANAIVGNPPFLGDKKLIGDLGEAYVTKLRSCFKGRVPGGADLVTHWFEKARGEIAAGNAAVAGLVATNSISGGKNRTVLDRIGADTVIFEVWADLDWVLDGAAVDVSLVCFGSRKKFENVQKALNGTSVSRITSSLTATSWELSRLSVLSENEGVASNGITKKGEFDVAAAKAREWLAQMGNPNARPNSDVLFPWINGLDVTRRSQDMWIIDFGERALEEAAQYESPWRWVESHVYPERAQSRTPSERRDWWLLARRATALRSVLRGLTRFIVVPEVTKHLVFVWCDKRVIPDKNVIGIARDDDTSFGCLHSIAHRLWARATGTSLEDRPRYTSTTTFRTFPFPEGFTPNMTPATYADDAGAKIIAAAAAKLNELRENWLNPPDLVKREPEVVPGYPDRVLPRNLAAAEQLKKRTLTNLYNERPAWLAHAHRDLDRAAAAAYGWPESLADRAQPENPDAADRKIAEEEILKRLFDLNQERAKAGR
ncbi:class I SAM-dependent DNA methyltransferase [Reyranella sp.]|uniref:class I SAM-dependent DNA methyltransferase n=1 Tax=Reyranella sp. TaxID=1929291 RepID=UPI002F924D5D